jgi:hypothetical protein
MFSGIIKFYKFISKENMLQLIYELIIWLLTEFSVRGVCMASKFELKSKMNVCAERIYI